MKLTNWSEKDLDDFCQSNFLDDDIAEKLMVFMKGQEGSINVTPKKGDEHSIANLKIDIVLSA